MDPITGKKRILKIAATLILAAVALGGFFYAGFAVGERTPKNIVVSGASNMTPASGTVSAADFNVFWQAWQTINDNYLRNTSTSNQTKLYGAIDGLVNSLGDPYTVFFTPKQSNEFQQDVEGNFGGVGIELGMKKGQLVVIAPLKGTPAGIAGILAGDEIIKVDSTSTEGITIDQAVQMIRGPEGTPVTLTIYRDGWKAPKDFKLTRAAIQAPTLDFEMKENIAYMHLYSFNANASQLFYQDLIKAANANAQGLVLDLRDDPGGYLGVAVDLAGWFVPRGTLVVKEAGRNGDGEEFRADGTDALKDFPTVILINKGSASAAEILAGSLRDDRHIKLVGEQSFGKGTVQQLMDLSDGSSIKVTIAHWVLPSGQVLENGGLTPDVNVTSTDADATAGRDPQLDKALEIVKSEIK